MEPKDEWVFFREIDWECPKNNRFNLDTRDFHCGYYWLEENHKDWQTLRKYPERFFMKREELESLLERYFNESGGNVRWRYLSLESYDQGWLMKYLRIFRTELGFLVCDSELKAIKKEVLNGQIKKELLGSH